MEGGEAGGGREGSGGADGGIGGDTGDGGACGGVGGKMQCSLSRALMTPAMDWSLFPPNFLPNEYPCSRATPQARVVASRLVKAAGEESS